jgi:hypothetical protein
LTWLKTVTNASPKLGRWQMLLEQFDFEVIYKEGKLNTNADALSRITVNNTTVIELASELTEEIIHTEQTNDNILQKVRSLINGENVQVPKNSKLWPFASKIEEFFITTETDIMYRQTNDGVTQIVLPPSLHETVFEMIHEQPCVGHCGADKNDQRFSSHFYWPNIKPKIIEFVRKCRECALRKPSRENTTAPLKSIKSSKPLEILQIDFVGPFTETVDKKKYLLCCIDKFTKHAQVYATQKCDSQTVIDCLEQYCCTFGIPEKIQSDNGKAFVSNNFNTFCDVFGIKPVKSTTYHAQSQGLVEHFNGTLTKMLASYTNEKQDDWSSYVNLCVFAYNTSIQKSIKISPHEAMFGQTARTTFSSLIKHQNDVKSPAEYATKMKRHLQEIHKNVKMNQDFADEASKRILRQNKSSRR